MTTLRTRAGNAAVGAVIVVAALALLGGAWWLFLAPRPGIIEVVSVQAIQQDGDAVLRVQLRFVKEPRGGDASHVVVNTYSEAFALGGDRSMTWNDLAAKDDSDATQPNAPPPLGEVVTFDMPMQAWVDYARVDAAQSYNANVDVTWADDVVVFTDVDITDAINDGGQITITTVELSGGDTTPAVVDVTFRVDFVPAGGDLTDLTLRASSQAMTSDMTVGWNEIALRDDSTASTPGQPPPVGELMTIRLHIEPNLRDSITTYGSQSVGLNVAIDWLGRQRDSGRVDVGRLYNR